MSELFNRLKATLKKREKEQGIRPTDLLTLPAPQRRVMQTLMRGVQMTYPELCAKIQALPAKQQMAVPEIDAALVALIQQGWLIKLGQDELVTYRVNLRRKAGSKVSESVWGKLDERIQDRRGRS